MDPSLRRNYCRFSSRWPRRPSLRPISLTVENFGPYVERAFVDFSSLGEFFLICGKTGSGKSSLFDAMVYALFGEAPGARKGFEGTLRSDFAGLGAIPAVEFVFSLSRTVYRAKRTAPYERLKRGGGITPVPPDAELSVRKGDSWEVLASGVRECTGKIESLVGLTADEFSKIILLPQGAFQQFLEMDSSKRGEVLEKLFPVDVYDRVANIAKREVDLAKARFQAVSDDLAAVSRDLGENPEERAEEGRKGIAAAEVAELEASQAVSAAEGRLERARLEVERFSRCEALERRLGDLDRESAEMDELERRLLAAHAAVGALPAVESHARATAAARDRAERLSGLEREIGELEASAPRRDAERGEAAELAVALEGARREVFRLERALESWQKRQYAFERREKALRILADLEESLKNSFSVQASLAARIGELEFAPGEDLKAAKTLESAQVRLEDLRKLSGLAGRYASLARDFEASRDRLAAALAAAEREKEAERLAAEALARLESELTRNSAAMLAKILRRGEPCPVCGSKNHPKPAHFELDFSDAAAGKGLEGARSAHVNAIARKASAQADLNHLHERVSELEKAKLELKAEIDGALAALELTVNSDEFFATASQMLEDQDRLVGKLKADVDSLAERLSARAALEREMQLGRNSLDALRSELESARIEAAQATALLEEISRISGTDDPAPALEAAQKNCSSIEERRKRLIADADEAEQRLAQARAIREALSHEDRVAAASIESDAASLAVMLTERGFLQPGEALAVGADRVRSSAMPADRIAEGEKAVAEYRQARAAAQTELASLRNEVSPTAPDLPAFESALSAARGQLAAARDRILAIRLESGALDQAIARRDALAAKRDELASGNALLLRLAELIRGDLPPRRLPLKNFVLATYFREVIGRASIHLSTMSLGRYYLKPDDGNASGRGRSGLGLRIVDSWTGQDRPSGTLSGGEKFLTSLSLAFGLADSLRERRGGVSLDSVFVDEGFGSLDEEALDRAVDVLDRIRGSRVIGIVSHVGGLKSRIPSRIEVEKSESGSRLSLVLSPAVE